MTLKKIKGEIHFLNRVDKDFVGKEFVVYLKSYKKTCKCFHWGEGGMI